MKIRLHSFQNKDVHCRQEIVSSCYLYCHCKVDAFDDFRAEHMSGAGAEHELNLKKIRRSVSKAGAGGRVRGSGSGAGPKIE